MICNQKKDIKKVHTTTIISAEDWYEHFKNTIRTTKNMYDQTPADDDHNDGQAKENTIRIEMEDIMKTLKSVR